MLKLRPDRAEACLLLLLPLPLACAPPTLRTHALLLATLALQAVLSSFSKGGVYREQLQRLATSNSSYRGRICMA
jgi:hypothetical protein